MWVSLLGAKALWTSALARWMQMLGIRRMGSSMCTKRCTSPVLLYGKGHNIHLLTDVIMCVACVQVYAYTCTHNTTLQSGA